MVRVMHAIEDFLGDPGVGVTPGSIQIDFDPNDSQEAIADLIILRLQTTPGLDLDPVKTTGPARVHLGSVNSPSTSRAGGR